MTAIYDRLKRIARSQRFKIRNSGLNTTALVNEAWLKSKKDAKVFNSRNHFFAYCALAMRHILINTAKRKRLVTFVEDPAELDRPAQDQADYLIDLERQLVSLGRFNARLEQVFVYKYFGDMDFADIAEVLSVSERTVFRDWQKARAMLATALA